jgi:hypothetical protein
MLAVFCAKPAAAKTKIIRVSSHTASALVLGICSSFKESSDECKQQESKILPHKTQGKSISPLSFENHNFLTTYLGLVQPGFQQILDLCLCFAATYVYYFDVKIPEFVGAAVVDPEIRRKV